MSKACDLMMCYSRHSLSRFKLLTEKNADSKVEQKLHRNYQSIGALLSSIYTGRNENYRHERRFIIYIYISTHIKISFFTFRNDKTPEDDLFPLVRSGCICCHSDINYDGYTVSRLSALEKKTGICLENCPFLPGIRR